MSDGAENLVGLTENAVIRVRELIEEEGEDILALDRAHQQDIRELHIGLLNMMPDSALQATERQFLRLVGGCNRIAQFYVHPFTVQGIERSADTQAYIDAHYAKFEDLEQAGLDALIELGPEPTLQAKWPGEALTIIESLLKEVREKIQ